MIHAPRGFIRTGTLLVTLVLAAVFIWTALVARSAYTTGPQRMAELESARALPFDPSTLPRTRLCALLVVQDPTFYRHHGVGLTDGPLGHTTITQGLGKALFFDHYDPGRLHYRKMKLMVAAWGLDRSVAKGTQLRVFVNRAYLGSYGGQEVLGFAAAAKAYFGKGLEALSDQEYFALLAMLDAPDRYNVLRQPELNAARVRNIEQRVQIACGPGCFAGNNPVPCGQDERRIESGVR